MLEKGQSYEGHVSKTLETHTSLTSIKKSDKRQSLQLTLAFLRDSGGA